MCCAWDSPECGVSYLYGDAQSSFYPRAWTVVSRIHVNLVGKELP